jgi:hypothetical protein
MLLRKEKHRKSRPKSSKAGGSERKENYPRSRGLVPKWADRTHLETGSQSSSSDESIDQSYPTWRCSSQWRGAACRCNSQSESPAVSDPEGDDSSWSVDTVVEVMELDCDRLQGRAASCLPDCLLFFCLACLLIRIMQAFVEHLLSPFFSAEKCELSG